MKDWWEVFDKNNADSRYADYDDYINRTFGTGRASYDDGNEQFWQSLNQWLPHAQYIDIYGAEPTLIHRLFDILQHSIDSGYHKNQTLHFNTNCTIWNQTYIDILSQFKQVYFDLSIDGLYNHYDYIRNGETWDVVLTNFNRYKEFANTYYQHPVSVCITVSMFNIYYIDEIFEYFENQLNTHFNMAHMPLHVSIKALPTQVKQRIREKLLQSKSEKFLREVAPILSYMDEELSIQQTNYHYPNGVWPEVVRSTTELDQLRKQSFKDTFPEFFAILEPYWN